MLTRKRSIAVFGSLLLSFSVQVLAAQKNGSQPTPLRPPTIRLEADSEVVTLCPDDEQQANPRVRLKAVGNSPDGLPLRYRWQVSGGRLEGDGTEVVWDLSNAAPGLYTASVTVESGPTGDPLCTAFTSARVVVRHCPPQRPVCPNISMSCPDVAPAGSRITFTANVSGGTAVATPVYRWKVSAGAIIAGQGSPTIAVDTTAAAGQPITATLEVEGYNVQCRATCQSAVPAPVSPRKSNEIAEVKRDEEKALLDLYAIELQNAPGARGYIIGYGGRQGRSVGGQRRADRARDYLVNTRGIEASRIVVIDGGLAETGRTELWIVPPGATPPQPR